MNIVQRVFTFLTFFVCCGCLAFLTVSLATQEWVEAKPVMLVYVTNDSIPQTEGKFKGEVSFGLFHGKKNTQLRSRPPPLNFQHQGRDAKESEPDDLWSVAGHGIGHFAGAHLRPGELHLRRHQLRHDTCGEHHRSDGPVRVERRRRLALPGCHGGLAGAVLAAAAAQCDERRRAARQMDIGRPGHLGLQLLPAACGPGAVRGQPGPPAAGQLAALGVAPHTPAPGPQERRGGHHALLASRAPRLCGSQEVPRTSETHGISTRRALTCNHCSLWPSPHDCPLVSEECHFLCRRQCWG
uniref:Putative secreted protein n=1 Tax=Ixodes ricinus TaxID=34613 RepID=A0A147BH97_IXORI